MSTNKTDVVGEYLREVELRLSGLPLLQRRELLADLETHIETARVERNIQSEGELIEVLERLGSPEVVAAAAYEENQSVRTPPRPAGLPIWVRLLIAGAIGFLVLFVLGFVFLFTLGGSVEPATSVPDPVLTATVDPTPTS
jgi:uncharacterized membrane protein